MQRRRELLYVMDEVKFHGVLLTVMKTLSRARIEERFLTIINVLQ